MPAREYHGPIVPVTDDMWAEKAWWAEYWGLDELPQRLGFALAVLIAVEEMDSDRRESAESRERRPGEAQ